MTRWIGLAVLLCSVPTVAQAQQQADDEQTRTRAFVHDIASPGTLLASALKAGLDYHRDEPEEWDQTHPGYGGRFASVAGRFAVQTSITHGLAGLMDRPTRYQRCGCQGRLRRLRHALVGVITDPTSGGGRSLAVPRLAGAYGGAFTQLAWQPESVGAKDALKSGTAAFLVGSAIQNLVREFVGARIPILAH
jgi:hypothetical protein